MVPSDVDGLTPCSVELAPDNPDSPASPCTHRQCRIGKGPGFDRACENEGAGWGFVIGRAGSAWPRQMTSMYHKSPDIAGAAPARPKAGGGHQPRRDWPGLSNPARGTPVLPACSCIAIIWTCANCGKSFLAFKVPGGLLVRSRAQNFTHNWCMS